MLSRAVTSIVFAILLGAYITWPALSQFGVSTGTPSGTAQNSSGPNLLSVPGGQASRGGGRPTQPVTPWQRPSGPPPAWLAAGQASIQAENALRQKLENTLVIDKPVDMARFLNLLSDADIPVEFNERALHDHGLEADQVRSLPAFEAAVVGSARELLSRALAKNQLAYCVRESLVEITSDQGDANSGLRYFDLSHVLPNESNVRELLSAIEDLVQPNTSPHAVGQLLVVRATEAQCMEIARMLSQLGPINAPQINATQTNSPASNQPFDPNVTPLRAKATGVVTFRGKPLEGVRVDFVHFATGERWSRQTDNQGRFGVRSESDDFLESFHPQVGTHSVTLHPAENHPANLKRAFSEKYYDAKFGSTVEVQARQENTFSFSFE